MAVGSIGDIIGSVVSQIVSWVVGIIAYLFLIITLIIALLKLWFALLKAYISILIDVIFAPFWIISGLIPGQQSAGFGAWLRDMAGNLAAFPAAIMMFLLAKLFTDNFAPAATLAAGGSNAVSPTNFIPPLIGSDAAGYFANLIALGVILATPGIVDMTKKAFKAPKLELGAIGKSVGAGPRVLMGGVNTAMTGLSVAYQVNMLRRKPEVAKNVNAPPDPKANTGGGGI
jgi:hypothetical protein